MSGASAKDADSLAAYEAVIGLEVHVQLDTRSKLFCSCENRFGAEPNSLTCPVCLGHPGSLPVLNRDAVRSAVRVGLACGSEIALFTKFDRKNYYYPDLPKNYQISQYDLPIAAGGHVDLLHGGEPKRIGLVRIHLEEDAGKNIHSEDRPESWIDLNRAGVPLLEIVTRPDIRSPEEAGAFLRALRLLMLYLEVSDCNMEQGSLRCDSNVSVRPRGSESFETRTEIKNLNSFAHVEAALRHEIRRQIRVRAEGRAVEQETRLYDPARDETRPMRGKEEAQDYRYFPEPDLPPLRLERAWVESLRETLPELPLARRDRYVRSFGLSAYHAEVLVRDRDLAAYFEACVRCHPEAREVANWVVNDVLQETNARGVSVAELGISPERLAQLLRSVAGGKVSRQKAKDVFAAMIGNSESAESVIRSLGLEQVSDDAVLRAAIVEVIAENPRAAEAFRAGEKKSLNFLIGQTMRRMRGQGNPGVVARIIQEILGA
ncbi:MAG: Asp-tRNA(Asn)/Glu-tRNA(Gln) amidotransferase subunit GatB [Planctomycetota bacterium]